MSDDLAWEVRDGVARIRLSRAPRRNALTREMLETFRRRLHELALARDVRLLRLEAEGAVFCAGMDLQQMQETAARSDAEAHWLSDARLYRDVVGGLLELPVPTLAVVGGPVVAGGVGLVCACDLAIATPSATFALPEPQRGITAAVVTPLLCHRVGPGIASHLLLSGESWSADDALRWGLCHRLVAADDLESAADRLSESVLRGSPPALRETKRFLQSCSHGALSSQLDVAAVLSAQARGTPDAREGLRAFLERRPPGWIPAPPGQ